MSSFTIAQPCINTTITPSFDSECMITEFGRLPDFRAFQIDETKCNTVCKNSTVFYTIAYGGDDNVTWDVLGADSFIVLDQGRVKVIWGNGNSGEGSVSVYIERPDGTIYTETLCVRLIDRPKISATTIPAANSAGIISVCRGQSVQFMNTTTAVTGERPIVGHFWSATGPNNFFEKVTDNNYTLNTHVSGTYTVTHTTINSCGCDTTETYKVIVSQQESNIKLSCYGTVCAGTVQEYSIVDPVLGAYHWSVKNGQILNGQNTMKISILWENPPEGFGEISINSAVGANLCSNSIKIPVIPSNAVISGPDTVCLGESQIYNTTLWGSTKYDWQVSDNNNNYYPFSFHEVQNGILCTFHYTGTYTIKLNYYNYFLECEGKATKTVVVLPKLEINTPKSTICIHEPVTFTTNVNQPPSNWQIFDNLNHLVYSTHSSTLTYIFTTAGKYRITASNSDACNSATYIITVKSPPPPPEKISGSNTACPNSSNTYIALPSNSDYVLLWKLDKPCSSPYCSGNAVSIQFGDTVCNILVYQQDVLSGCVSDSVTFQIDPFVLMPMTTTSATVCAGYSINLSAPLQEHVFYKWTLKPPNAASVQGDNNSSDVTVLVNHLDIPVPKIELFLTRYFCGFSKIDTLILHTLSVDTPAISYPATVCRKVPASFTAYNSSGSGSYLWLFDDNTSSSNNPATKAFATAGQHTFTLQYSPGNGCNPIIVHGAIFVKEPPEATVTFDGNSNMTVTQQINVTYQWTLNGNIIPGATSNTVATNNLNGKYCCTVTDTVSGCSNFGCDSIPHGGGGGGLSCTQTYQLTLTSRLTDCNTYEIEVTNPPPNLPTLSWSIAPSNTQNKIVSTSQYTATATFGTAGYFTVFADAQAGSRCYTGRTNIIIDYVLRLKYSFTCPNILTVFDNSFYSAGYSIPSRTITVTGTNILMQQNLSSTQNTATFILPQLATSTQCTITMTIGNCTDTLKFTYEPLPTQLQMMEIDWICEGTPILFEASGVYAKQFKWNFGDGSSSFINPVYHTYGSAANAYTVSLTAYNAHGCSSSITKQIQSSSDNITGSLQPGSKVCMGEKGTVIFTPATHIVSYHWSVPPSPTADSIHFVYTSGDYFVTAISDIGCKRKSFTNAGFFNPPPAKIIGGNTCYCAGDNFEFSAYKTLETEPNITYSWSANIAGQNMGSNTPLFVGSIPNPCIPNKFTVYLTVSNGQCASTDSVVVEVFAKPSVPIIDFAGNRCIANPPVCLVSSANPPQNLFWNNGSFGDTACYYNAGYITAYYQDHLTGCRSDINSSIMICPSPNFDALLTGCFCTEKQTLPVYMITAQAPYNSNCGTPTYKWYYNNTLKSTYNYLPQQLPIANFGVYNMTFEYGNGNCALASPTLTINDCRHPDTCKVEVEPCYKICGKLYFDQMFRVCNRGDTTIVFNNLQPLPNVGYSVVSWSPNPLILVPGQCTNVIATVRVDNSSLPPGKLLLTDPTINCHSTECNVVIPMFDWRQCTDEDTCKFVSTSIVKHGETGAPFTPKYFDFSFELPTNSSLLSFWIEPNVLFGNYTYIFPFINGRLEFTHNYLEEWEVQEIDICVYAEISFGQQTCLIKLCYPARYFLNLLKK